jgi:hypothetical protein
MDEDIKLVDPYMNMQGPQPRPRTCPSCGGATTSLGGRCPQCLKVEFMREALKRQREYLSRDSREPLTLGKDRGRHSHIVLWGHPRLSWCGETVTEAPNQRRSLHQGESFPLGICSVCRGLYWAATKEESR